MFLNRSRRKTQAHQDSLSRLFNAEIFKNKRNQIVSSCCQSILLYDRNLHTVRVVFMPYSFFQSDPPCDHGTMIRDIFKRQYFGWWLVCSRVASTSVSVEFGKLPYDLVCIQCFGYRFFISQLPFQFSVFQQLSVMGAFFISALFSYIHCTTTE